MTSTPLQYIKELNVDETDIIKLRRNNTIVYYDEKTNCFIKKWNHEIIKEKYHNEQFKGLSPDLSFFWKYWKEYVLSEQNIWKPLWEIYSKKSESDKILSPEDFNSLKIIIENLLIRQIKTHLKRNDTLNIFNIEHLYIKDLIKEIESNDYFWPEWSIFTSFYKGLKPKPLKVVLNHWDFNLFNISKNRFFDLEDTWLNYLWIDIANLLFHHLFIFDTQKEWNKRVAYLFSKEQIEEIFEIFEKVTKIDFDTIFGYLLVLRLGWWLSDMHYHQNIFEYRKEKWIEMINLYNKGELNKKWLIDNYC